VSKNRSAAGQNSVPEELKTLAATFLRVNTRDGMERVKFRGERFMIKTFGRPMVVLISYDDYLCVRQYLPSFRRELATQPISTPLTSFTDSVSSSDGPSFVPDPPEALADDFSDPPPDA